MTEYELFLTDEASHQLDILKKEKSKKIVYKAVVKSLKLMSENLRHPSLETHEFHSKKGPNNEKIFETYAQNNTPGAYRIFWYYGQKRKEIIIILITPHP